jgi:hypothetical protein
LKNFFSFVLVSANIELFYILSKIKSTFF